MSRQGLLGLLLALGLLGFLLGRADRSASPLAPLDKARPVLALGDSLTAGFGASPGADYPSRLAARTGLKVINGGVSGDTSAQALARLPELLRQKPQLVLVGIGGNDFLRRLPLTETRANITAIIAACRAAGARVMLIAIPAPTLGAALGSPSDHPLYAEIAATEKVPLLENLWSPILGDSALKSDEIHANAAGYDRFAERLATALRRRKML